MSHGQPEPPTSGERPKVLVAGAGVAALETMLALRQLAGERVEIELLSPESAFRYRPLDVAEPFGLGRVEPLDLAELTRRGGAEHRLGALAAVDADRKRVETEARERISYDALVIALGARAREVLPGALTFRGAPDFAAFAQLLAELERGQAKALAFVLPGESNWPLPLYELALMTARHRAEHHQLRTKITLVTHEAAPLELFGQRASEAIGELLERDGIELVLGRYATSFADDRLQLVPGDELVMDRVVALPALELPELPGLPQGRHGFIPTDLFGHVVGLEDVYAAGDATTFPIKQGGLATQQADVVARSLAAWAGAGVEPEPFHPVLRGQLLTGGAPRYLRADLTGGQGDTSAVEVQPLWWPPIKIAGVHLAPFLAELGVSEPSELRSPGGLDVEIELTERLPELLGAPQRSEGSATSPLME